MKDCNVAVIGGGSWGTTVASLVSRNTKTVIWARDSQTVDEINREHRNSRYLGELPLNPKLSATADLEEAVANADVVVMGVPSNSFRSVLESISGYLKPEVPLVSLTKGLEKGTRLRMTEICKLVAPGHTAGVLTGPNLAKEILAGQAAASVISTDNSDVTEYLRELFNGGLFRVYSNRDVIGCELGGVLKNLIAIAVGMGDGLGAGDNTRAALITRGLAEMGRLGTALGGEPLTFAGLAGMGDMIATCTSAQSRNRHVGVELAKGRAIDDIIDSMHMVAEGVKSAPTVIEIARERNISMPISEDVYKVIIGESNAKSAYRGLLRTTAGAEHAPG
ncbi:glycerol-3-phosphate dehydrogenase [NAD(P)+] 2 [Luminiphilus syltensis NOR5-1B]|uniref:Glycerol-3-phosphate dehydrogenase [NAD(P)+] n=1 Tax=Luminiphilus syltensis NOR5-1B TaxID=565045 RepID=B8KTL2_9GAMM|nr:NAD(P)H-dependent glycerol-3-phosphate dehydrogenase [Luminiphilus syltensis]EED36127.1 glycerol-3-phosphate dehydrogenase [NAD(P)+] 2 [Luminiphilus syltensis NOR5-1B]